MDEDEVKAALSPYHVLGLTLWAEARGQPLDGIVAVGCVIRNRADLGVWYGKDIKGVCLKPKQFSCWNEGMDENHVRLMKLAELFVADYAIRSTVKLDPTLDEALFLGEGVMNRRLRNPVPGCTHYCTLTLFEQKPPAWAIGRQPDRRIGSHVFFKNVD